MGLKVEFTTDREKFNSCNTAKINYSAEEFENCITVVPHSILFDYGIKDYEIEVINHVQFHKLFFKTLNGSVPFDLFAAAFWLLTRYEEYLPHKTDSFNRFHYKASLAYQYDFLHLPLINLWLKEFQKLLSVKYPDLSFKTRQYNFISTVDIDNAYMYKYKGFVRTMAGYLADLLKMNFKGIKNRTSIILNKNNDPFDCYDFLISTNQENEIDTIYFFLLGDYGINDKNHSATNLRFQSLIKHLADYSEIGIHPSFGSTDNSHQLKVEISRLANITHKQIFKSRQHFSILKFPETYQSLLQAGITEDYTMGYTNINGFRASYCYPYKWYNLDEEFTTALTIHSFALAENTVDFFAAKSNHSFSEVTSKLINEVKGYNGELISIFHNSTFNERMKKQYLDFIKTAKTNS